MKELDSMYDIIFLDNDLKKIFLNFHSKNWYKLSIETKEKLLADINEKVASLYGYTPCKLKFAKGYNYGSHSSFKNQIHINISSLENDCGYEVIDTYFHELRHSFQCRAIENELTSKEHASEEERISWKRNFYPGNYVNSGEFYKYQEVEKDAWSVGMLFARKIYMLNKKSILEKDEKWFDYCKQHKQIIVEFISENEDAKKLLNTMAKKINDNYHLLEEDENEYNRGKEIVKEILKNKTFDELSFLEVGKLLSFYAYEHLDIFSKVALLSKYRDFVKYGNRKYDICVNTTGSIKAGNQIMGIDGITIVNSLLSYNFKMMCDDIMKGKKVDLPLTDRALKEIKLNLYKDKSGKMINFIKDSDNLMLFSLQPYAKYESYYILNEFAKLKKIELETYGKNHSSWKYWDDFYDNKLIYKTASQVMDMPFSEYYGMQLGVYRERINKSINDIR